MLPPAKVPDVSAGTSAALSSAGPFLDLLRSLAKSVDDAHSRIDDAHQRSTEQGSELESSITNLAHNIQGFATEAKSGEESAAELDAKHRQAIEEIEKLHALARESAQEAERKAEEAAQAHARREEAEAKAEAERAEQRRAEAEQRRAEAEAKAAEAHRLQQETEAALQAVRDQGAKAMEAARARELAADASNAEAVRAAQLEAAAAAERFAAQVEDAETKQAEAQKLAQVADTSAATETAVEAEAQERLETAHEAQKPEALKKLWLDRKATLMKLGQAEKPPLPDTHDSKRARGNWLRAYQKVKLRRMVSKMSMLSMRVDPANSMGARTSRLEKLLHSMEAKMATVERAVDADAVAANEARLAALEAELAASRAAAAAGETALAAALARIDASDGKSAGLAARLAAAERALKKHGGLLDGGGTDGADGLTSLETRRKANTLGAVWPLLEALAGELRAKLRDRAKSAAWPGWVKAALPNVLSAVTEALQQRGAAESTALPAVEAALLAVGALIASDDGASGEVGSTLTSPLREIPTDDAAGDEAGDAVSALGLGHGEVRGIAEAAKDALAATVHAHLDGARLSVLLSKQAEAAERATPLSTHSADLAAVMASLATKADLDQVAALSTRSELEKLGDLAGKTARALASLQAGLLADVESSRRTAEVERMAADLGLAVSKFGQLEKEVGTKAASAEMINAIDRVKAQLSSMDSAQKAWLAQKVDKADIAKIASALGGGDSADPVMAAKMQPKYRCLSCNRPLPGMAHSGPDKSVWDGDTDDNASQTSQVSNARSSRGGTREVRVPGGGGARRPRTGGGGGGDAAPPPNFVTDPALATKDGETVSRYPRMMPKQIKTRNAAGGGARGGGIGGLGAPAQNGGLAQSASVPEFQRRPVR